MKKKAFCFLLIFVVFISAYGFTSQQEFKWGGHGYDPALKGKNSSRFAARPHFKDETVIDIVVNDKKTVREVGGIDLISSEGVQISSEYCAKTMRHIEAPWACGFNKAKIQKMNGSGTMKVFNRSNKLLFKDEIDFDAINQLFGNKPKLKSTENQLSVPEKVGLYFQHSQNDNNMPAIVFTVFAGSGCDQVGDLQITKNLKLNQPNIYTKGGRIDILEIQIKGYKLKKATTSANITCPAVIQEARAIIELDDVMNNQQLQLNIILNNQANEFGLNHYDDVLYLNPMTVSQVVSWNPGENMPARAQGLGFMTKSFQLRLVQVRLNGSYAHKSDIGTSLRDYVRNLGYQPLDEKLQGYPRMNPLDEFIVFVPNGKDIPEEFRIIGKVNYHEIPGGDKIIDVGIIKKKAVDPFFVRWE
ncbi:MAG: hypothetical protein K8S27_10435 [Candidatus Omnitrophica bacterium]|nr:hypothetical protein [Candidatus Omnitrophota bacterium]